MGPHLHRPPTLRRDRGPDHLRSPHRRDRHPVLPATRQPTPTHQTSRPARPGKEHHMIDTNGSDTDTDGYDTEHDNNYDRVTAHDIAEFLHHLAELRNGHAESVLDPAQRAAF